jgi:hypothetical protein
LYRNTKGRNTKLTLVTFNSPLLSAGKVAKKISLRFALE